MAPAASSPREDRVAPPPRPVAAPRQEPLGYRLQPPSTDRQARSAKKLRWSCRQPRTVTSMFLFQGGIGGWDYWFDYNHLHAVGRANNSNRRRILMFDLSAVQSAIQGQGLDGWLLYDIRGLNVLARRVVGLGEEQMLSRRWFYYIPARGEARKLCHRIEPHDLNALPGSSQTYLRWQELEAGVGGLVQGARKVAMEYVPRNANPYVSRVDAGTVELVRSFGVEIVPSDDLVQRFEACWDDDQWAMHLEAAKHTRSAYDVAFRFIAERVRRGGSVRETEVQQCILDHFKAHGLVTDHPPICAVGPHSGDPHYSPGAVSDAPIRAGDFVLIDLWAKLERPRAVYSDLTWTCFVGKEVPKKYADIFKIVARARDAAIARVQEAFRNHQPLQGWQVDQAAREVIDRAG